MRVQIELTTRCNFDCFYCAGRDMPQGDMPFDQFKSILKKHIAQYGVPLEVSLQGEGEPTLHKDFFAMADMVKHEGSEPYTITNGTFKHPENFLTSFRSVGVSIDTLDAGFAREIGRYNLPRVLSFVEDIRTHLQVNIHTVAIAKDLPDIARYCKERGLRHIVQPLQTKQDYSYRYQHIPLKFKRPQPFSCSFLRDPLMRYYDLNGTEMPCCFIKNSAELPGLKEMQAMESRHVTPVVCQGCHFGIIK